MQEKGRVKEGGHNINGKTRLLGRGILRIDGHWRLVCDRKLVLEYADTSGSKCDTWYLFVRTFGRLEPLL